MKIEQAIKVAKSYNRWRTGEDKRNQTDWMREDNITFQILPRRLMC